MRKCCCTSLFNCYTHWVEILLTVNTHSLQRLYPETFHLLIQYEFIMQKWKSAFFKHVSSSETLLEMSE